MPKIDKNVQQRKCDNCNIIKYLKDFRSPCLLNNCRACPTRVKILKDYGCK